MRGTASETSASAAAATAEVDTLAYSTRRRSGDHLGRAAGSLSTRVCRSLCVVLSADIVIDLTDTRICPPAALAQRTLPRSRDICPLRHCSPHSIVKLQYYIGIRAFINALSSVDR